MTKSYDILTAQVAALRIAQTKPREASYWRGYADAIEHLKTGVVIGRTDEADATRYVMQVIGEVMVDLASVDCNDDAIDNAIKRLTNTIDAIGGNQ